MNTDAAVASHFSELKNRIEKKQAKVGIIGLGYVGLPLALLYSEQKFVVTGFDIDSRKVSTLDQGGSYIVRIAPAEIQAAKKHGFNATADYSRISEMDAVIICVPTPLNEYHEPDLSYITDTATAILDISDDIHPCHRFIQRPRGLNINPFCTPDASSAPCAISRS